MFIPMLNTTEDILAWSIIGVSVIVLISLIIINIYISKIKKRIEVEELEEQLKPNNEQENDIEIIPYSETKNQENYFLEPNPLSNFEEDYLAYETLNEHIGSLSNDIIGNNILIFEETVDDYLSENDEESDNLDLDFEDFIEEELLENDNTSQENKIFIFEKEGNVLKTKVKNSKSKPK